MLLHLSLLVDAQIQGKSQRDEDEDEDESVF